MEVCFFDAVSDDLLKFAVIVSRHEGKWVFCRHRDRTTWECPGGHREPGEAIADTARRELWEETGAKEFSLSPVCVYSVRDKDGETFGMLCFAEISAFGDLPPLEIQEVRLFDRLPENWTYPQIQPCLFRKIRETVGISD
jgi:8-oxo-dGTP diphosphatase